MNNMNNRAITILIIVIIMSFTGCIDTKNNPDGNKIFNIRYEVNISNINEMEININIPIVIYSNNTVLDEIFVNIEKSPNTVYSIIDSKYGSALNITSKEKSINLYSEIDIEWKDSFSRESFPIRLSMPYEYDKPNWILTSDKFWIYSNISNITITINFNSYVPGGGGYSYLTDEINLEIGWQIMDVEERCKVV